MPRELSWLKRSRGAPVQGPGSLRSLFRKFRRILELNNKVLERMAAMERALSGEYIFDRAFLQASVRDLGMQVHQVAYSINALSDDRYLTLYDRFEALRNALDDILSGGLGPWAARLTLPSTDLSWESEALAGSHAVILAELRQHMGLPSPDGFVVTATGCARLLDSSGLRERLLRPAASGGLAPDHPEDDVALPADLAEAVEAELRALFARRGGPCRLLVSACPAGEPGPHHADAEAVRDVAPADLPAALVSALARWLLESGSADRAASPVALSVHESTQAAAQGSALSLDLADGAAGAVSILAFPAGSPDSVERYLLRRAAPFHLLASDIRPKAVRERLPDGSRPLSYGQVGLLRGSALLSLPRLATLAEMALSVERVLGGPQVIRWAMDGSGRLVIESARSAARTEDEGNPAGLVEALDVAEVFLRGGETAQAGVAAGRIARVREDAAEEFPLGAVAVARAASPRLSPVLRRAAALVTEIGSTAGHLATIAREMRVPALFGVAEALRLLPEGEEVTLDAGEGVVYRGTVEPLLRHHAQGLDLGPSDPEYILLRRLLRLIMPLNLVDPESPDFTPEGCRTLHDIIHFAHEKAVEELLAINDRRDSLRGMAPHRLALETPVEVRVLDVGGGLAEDAGPEVEREDVRSEPLLAFLAGMRWPDAWRGQPAGLRMRDVFSGFGRSMQALSTPPEHSGPSLAIAAQNYLNLSLRLGYHFNVVDAYMTDNPGQNYIYFRFAGGFAEERRRRRRAELVRRVLERMDFKVTVAGDLVTGKLKVVTRAEMEAALEQLGALVGFTRQLDTAMAADSDVDAFAKAFLSLVEAADTGQPEGADV